MQPQETGNIGFAARFLENGIHEFTWVSSSRETVDVWMEYNDSLYNTCTPEDTLYFLHIIKTANLPSLTYVVRKARDLQEKHPEQPKTRSAILFQSRFFGGFINMLSMMLNKEGIDITKVFAMDEREQAIEWLLSDAP